MNLLKYFTVKTNANVCTKGWVVKIFFFFFPPPPNVIALQEVTDLDHDVTELIAICEGAYNGHPLLSSDWDNLGGGVKYPCLVWNLNPGPAVPKLGVLTTTLCGLLCSTLDYIFMTFEDLPFKNFKL